MIIKEFNPPYLCPYKHKAINIYTNCAFGCKYCYAGKNKEFKAADLTGLIDELKANKGVIEIGTYTDSYQPLEKRLELMRTILNGLIKYPSPIVINTKSTLILRDIDLLKELSSKTTISIGISINKESNNVLDGNAPAPKERINTLKTLLENGINAYLRYDPIIPFYNDDEESINEVLREFASTNLKRVTISTYKPTSKKQLKAIDNILNLDHKLERFYSKGVWTKGSLFLPKEVRKGIIDKFIKIADRYGLITSACREGMAIGLCDNIDYNLFSNSFKKFY